MSDTDRGVTLVADSPIHPYLVRAYRSGRLVAYAIEDTFGWAIVATHGLGSLRTIDRWTPILNETPRQLRDAAVECLTRYAVTGTCGDGWVSPSAATGRWWRAVPS